MSKSSAIVYAEGGLGKPGGKTANGLVRFSRRFTILGVIDSPHTGKDAAEVLDDRPLGIPVFSSLNDALKKLRRRPRYFIFGLAPDGGRLPASARPVICSAIRAGLHIMSGLHEYLGEDKTFVRLARQYGVKLLDVRKPPPKEKLHFFTGKINQVNALKVAVLGTDSAIGKRTTALLITEQLNAASIKTEFIGTGQTAWLQGARYCIMMDALPNDFVAGELEHTVCKAWQEQRPQVIIVEGQGSLFHPAYPGGFELLAATQPDFIVLQHAPGRKDYDGFPGIPIPPLERYISLLEILAPGKPLALAINSEGLEAKTRPQLMKEYQRRWRVPVVEPITQGMDLIIKTLMKHLS